MPRQGRATGSVTRVEATVCLPPCERGNFLVEPYARISTSPRASGEPPATSVMYVPSRKPENATDFALERASVGVNGEKTLPSGDTTNTVGQRSPPKQLISASNCPAPATALAKGAGLPASSCAARSPRIFEERPSARRSPSALP